MEVSRYSYVLQLQKCNDKCLASVAVATDIFIWSAIVYSDYIGIILNGHRYKLMNWRGRILWR